MGHSSTNGYIHSLDYGFNGNTWRHANNKKHPYHIEITFEQFKEWVLNETPEVKELYSIY